MFFILLCALTSFLLKTSAINVTVTTDPSGPPYRAGSLFDVTCNASNGVPPYQYEWSIGCTFTNIFSNYIVYKKTIGPFTTTPIKCQNVLRCRATDNTDAREIAQVKIDPITDIAIQILLGQTFYLTRNLSILTVNDSSGKFLDIICNTGLKQPNIGKWILPNGATLTQSSEIFEVQRGGGVTSLPYITLGLKDDQSLDPEDTGLYTCVMPDAEMVERESHIWILQDQNFKPPEPEYFSSYSGRNLQLHCGYSNTPGKILWFINGILQSSDDKFQITQNLLRTSPTVLYEGVLEIVNANHIAMNGQIVQCMMFSTIIKSHADLFPESKTVRTRHYFFPRLIGDSLTLQCSFSNPYVWSSRIYADGKYLKSVYGRGISFKLDMITDETHNKEYSCIGLVIGGGESYYLNVSILALIPPHSIAMHIASLEIAFAGESLTLDLTAVKTPGFSFDLSIFCTNQKEIPLSELDEFNYPNNSLTVGLLLHVQVPITHVKLSHAGLYLCTAFLETPPLLDNISDIANTTITVKIPSPTVVLNNSLSLQTGGMALYNCEASLNRTYLDEPIHAVFTWMLGGLIIKSRDRLEISDISLLIDMDSYRFISSLKIAPVIREKDKGILTCSVFITVNGSNEYISDSPTVNRSVALEAEGPDQLDFETFQLKLLGLQERCSQWIVQPFNHTYLNIVSKHVLAVVTERCNCEYSIDYITDEHFQCPDEALGYVIYRAKISSSHMVEAEVLVEYIQNWVKSNSGIIRINNTDLFLSNDSNCEVIIGSFNDSSCVAPYDPVLAVKPTSSATIHSSNANVPVESTTTIHFTSSATINSLKLTSSATIHSSNTNVPVESTTTIHFTSSATINSLKPTSSATIHSLKPTSSATIHSLKPTSSATIHSLKPTSSTTIHSLKPTSSAIIHSLKPTSSTTVHLLKPTSSATIHSLKPTSSTTIHSSNTNVPEDPTSSVTVNSSNLFAPVNIIIGGLLLLVVLAITVICIVCIKRNRKSSQRAGVCTPNNPGEMKLCTFNYGDMQFNPFMSHSVNPAFDHNVIHDRRETKFHGEEEEWFQSSTFNNVNPAYDHIRKRRQIQEFHCSEEEWDKKNHTLDYSLAGESNADVSVKALPQNQCMMCNLNAEDPCRNDANKIDEHVYDYIEKYQ